jgi:hypothetical protein
MRRQRGIWVGICAAIFAAFAGCAGVFADQVVLTNGHVISGDIIAQDDESLTLDVSDANEARDLRIPQSHIARIETWGHPSSRGPEFVVLPIQGTIGVDTTAHGLKAGLDSVCRLGAGYVIFYIDSDGGSITEVEEMVDAIHTLRDGSVVAFVHKARSAAAVLAMACSKVFVTRDAMIGATTPLQDAFDGTPEDGAAKDPVAMEAKWRKWVTDAGHDDLLLRGMMETDLELFIPSRTYMVTQSASTRGRMIKARNEILTLTAKDAIDCGLAAPGYGFSDVAQQVAGRRCTEASQRPWDAVVRVSRLDKQNTQVAKQTIALDKDGIKKRLKEMDDRIAADFQKLTEVSNTKGFLAGADEINALQDDLQATSGEAYALTSKLIEMQKEEIEAAGRDGESGNQ